MFKSINDFITDRQLEFELIPSDRKKILGEIATYIEEQSKNSATSSLIYVCTHNARRSHFGQIAAALAASHFNLQNTKSFSAGMEVTEFHPNAIAALREIGFQIRQVSTGENPEYKVNFGTQDNLSCFSKTVDHPVNPSSGFLAIMVCSEADQNCPFVPNATKRISTPYEDPKSADATPESTMAYMNCFEQILRETLYAFSLVKK